MPHPGNEHRSSRVSFPTHCTLSIQIGPVPRPNEEPVVAEAASVKFSILVWNSDTNSRIIEKKINPRDDLMEISGLDHEATATALLLGQDCFLD